MMSGTKDIWIVSQGITEYLECWEIKHMCKQWLLGSLSPPPRKRGYEANPCAIRSKPGYGILYNTYKSVKVTVYISYSALYPKQQLWFNCDIHQEISLINPSLWQLLVSDWPMRVLVLELISHSNKAKQLAQTNVERQKRESRPLFTQMQEADVLINTLLVIA